MTRPLEEHKKTANRLAELLARQDMHAVFRCIGQLLAGRSGKQPAPGEAPAGSSPPARVGIWERTVKDGQASFVRVPGGDPWTFWANVNRIPPKTGKKRVLLLGESVARGYFYDPDFNPASALRLMLNASMGEGAAEVIDLARIDLTLEPLVELAASAVALAPDAMVIMAGNNWHYRWNPASVDMNDIADLLRSGGGLPALHSFIEDRLRAQIQVNLDKLAAMSKSRGIPIVFVIPEFNLEDWRSGVPGPPLLTPGKVQRWVEARRSAEEALARGENELAVRYAQEVLVLDCGTTAAGLNVLADVDIRLGALSQAREHLERARDAALSKAEPESPRCYAITRELLRSQPGFSVVDLRERFQDHLAGALPGRRLFHDYCHLTVEGIAVAMASAAESLLPLISTRKGSWVKLAKIPMRVDPEVAAAANLLGAVHNANYGQSPDVVRFQLEQSVQYCPAMKTLMARLLDLQLRRAPSCLCAGFEEVVESRNASIVQRLYTHPRTQKSFNSVLAAELAAIVGAGGPDLPGMISRVLTEEHAATGEGLDLLQPYYRNMAATAAFSGATDRPLWTGYIDSSRGESNSIFFKAREQTSRFLLTAKDRDSIGMAVTLRTPHAAPGSELAILVNGIHIASHPAVNTWKSVQIDIPSDKLNGGVNVLSIEWPPLPVWPAQDWIEGVASEFEAGRIPGMLPVYGEVHTLRVTARAESPVAAGHASASHGASLS